MVSPKKAAPGAQAEFFRDLFTIDRDDDEW